MYQYWVNFQVYVRIVNLSSCRYLEDISALGNLGSLHKLYLSKCVSLTDISPLSNLGNLNTFILMYCRELKDISALDSLPKLRNLNVSGMNLVGVAIPGKLTSPHTLRLSSCYS
jgi:Leucine-rich repeat (LRR) protein